MLKLARLHDSPEIFYSIQGEGKSLGVPSVFIRLSLCNLYCNWCDTDYTWNWEGTSFRHRKEEDPAYTKFNRKAHVIALRDEEIIRLIRTHQCHRLIFTGGEPLMQRAALLPLLAKLKALDPAYYIEVETNGTYIPGDDLDSLIDQYNVSVKLSNSGVAEKERIKERSIRWMVKNPKANFKFVVDTAPDVEEVNALVKKFGIPHGRVYLMPQGTQPSVLRQKQLWVLDLCKQFYYNFTDRLHIHLYGDQRGV